MMGLKRGKVWLGLILSGLFLILALRQVEWTRVMGAFGKADWGLVGLGVVGTMSAYVTLAFRWRALLSKTAALPVREVFSYVMIGYLTNTVFPLRLGEVTRAALLGRDRGISTSLVLGSVVLERTMDLLVMLTLAATLSWIVNVPPVVRAGMITIAGGGGLGLTGLVALAWTGSRLPGAASKLTSRTLVERIAKLASRFAQGLGALKDGRQLGAVLFLSVFAWALVGISTSLQIAAFHLPAPWFAGFFVMAVVGLGGAIPSSPSSVGVYHYFAVLALSVWVADQNAAVGYAIAMHGVMVLMNVLVGGLCLSAKGLSLHALSLSGKGTFT